MEIPIAISQICKRYSFTLVVFPFVFGLVCVLLDKYADSSLGLLHAGFYVSIQIIIINSIKNYVSPESDFLFGANVPFMLSCILCFVCVGLSLAVMQIIQFISKISHYIKKLKVFKSRHTISMIVQFAVAFLAPYQYSIVLSYLGFLFAPIPFEKTGHANIFLYLFTFVALLNGVVLSVWIRNLSASWISFHDHKPMFSLVFIGLCHIMRKSQ
ncbi:hypothetical protein ROZALSC1DRAFT_26583, partial [Rozella allomycis CSF55]